MSVNKQKRAQGIPYIFQGAFEKLINRLAAEYARKQTNDYIKRKKQESCRRL